MKEVFLDIRKHQYIISSILFHIVLVTVFFLWGDFKKNLTQEKQEVVWMDVDAFMPEEVQTKDQIVNTDQGEVVDQAKEDAYLGEKTQVVEKQTISKQSAPPQKSSESTQSTKSKIKDLSVLGLQPLKVKEQVEAAIQQENWAAQAGATQAEYVDGVDQSNQTLLNTKEYVYYTYFKRIRDKLDLAWRPLLKEHIDLHYQKGRSLANDARHQTKLLVTLNNEGQIIQVKLLSPSGAQDLDQAAISAFNRAGPFPNPPKKLMNSLNQIEIRWDFVLRT